MIDAIPAGLYRTTTPLPGLEDDIPAGVLVYVGERPDRTRFVVRPGSNRRNRWFWGEPVRTLPASGWMWTLKRLPSEGFYTLPETIELGQGGRWLKNAIVQLGYNEAGRGLIFIAEERDGETRNVLEFSSYGRAIDDALLERLVWAPILPVPAAPVADAN
ncbi:MAG: hypothetical protein U1F43_21500 [Myxococcota bacterium]